MKSFLKIKLIVILLIIVTLPVQSLSQSSKQSSNFWKLRSLNNNIHNLQLQDSTQNNEKTPLHFDTIAAEAFGGLFSGLIIGGLFYEISEYAIYAGMIVGSSIVVNYIGDRRGDYGSVWASFSGSLIGILIGISTNDSVIILAPSIGATIAYNLTRKPDSNTSSGGVSLINIKNSTLKLSTPQISFKYDNFFGGSGLIRSVNLLRISF